GQEVAPDESVEAFQSTRHRASAPRERPTDHAAFGFREDLGYILGLAHRRISLVEFVAHVEECDLPTVLVRHDGVDVVEALDALEFDARALCDGDVDVLSDRDRKSGV